MPQKSTKITYAEPRVMYLASTYNECPIESVKVHAESDKSFWVEFSTHYGRRKDVRIVQKKPDFILHNTW